MTDADTKRISVLLAYPDFHLFGSSVVRRTCACCGRTRAAGVSARPGGRFFT